jgi:hypothetical protein
MSTQVKKYTPFCDHFTRGYCDKCEAVKEKIKNEPFEAHKPLLEWRADPYEVAWKEARKLWLDELGYTEKDIFKINSREHTFLDGHTIRVPKELTSKEAFEKRVRERE